MLVIFVVILLGLGVYQLITPSEEEIKKQQEMEEQERKRKYKNLKDNVAKELGIANLDSFLYFNSSIIVKSRQSLEKYNNIRFFKDNKENLEEIEKTLVKKKDMAEKLRRFLESNSYKHSLQYHILANEIGEALKKIEFYVIRITYISPHGNNLGSKEVHIKQQDIQVYKDELNYQANKIRYDKILKEKLKKELEEKQKYYYNMVNNVIDYANKNKDFLIIKGDNETLDNLIGQLFDKTINSIKKIKSIESEEWELIKDFISNIMTSIEKIIKKNQQILEYYESDQFLKIKNTCEILINSQKEFNEYINEKLQSISKLFGTRVVRNATITDDGYNYIRHYKKTITPFTAEVSANVFASAENNPLDYVVKYFYPNKSIYKEQIQKLYLLIEELETLREAKKLLTTTN